MKPLSGKVRGADKSIMTLDGKTAYDYAVEHGRPEEITQLLHQG